MTHRPPVVLLGPTASGKSDVAMAAAGAVPGVEIVAVDAMQVYRGMDIGTAKPTPADRAAVPHHGIDLAIPATISPSREYHAAYDEAIDRIDARGAPGAATWPGPGSTSPPCSTSSIRQAGSRRRR